MLKAEAHKVQAKHDMDSLQEIHSDIIEGLRKESSTPQPMPSSSTVSVAQSVPVSAKQRGDSLGDYAGSTCPKAAAEGLKGKDPDLPRKASPESGKPSIAAAPFFPSASLYPRPNLLLGAPPPPPKTRLAANRRQPRTSPFPCIPSWTWQQVIKPDLQQVVYVDALFISKVRPVRH